jgi:hypothetical protein
MDAGIRSKVRPWSTERDVAVQARFHACLCTPEDGLVSRWECGARGGRWVRYVLNPSFSISKNALVLGTSAPPGG